MTDEARAPADRCACGHPRNQHSGYGNGRCLSDCRAKCERLTPPTAPVVVELDNGEVMIDQRSRARVGDDVLARLNR